MAGGACRSKIVAGGWSFRLVLSTQLLLVVPGFLTEAPTLPHLMSQPEKLRLSEKLSYSFGDLASCLFWQTFMLYLTYYYTDVFGISALATAARCWD